MPAVPRSVLAAVDFGDASARSVTLAGLIADRCEAKTLPLLHIEAAEAPVYFTHDQIEGLVVAAPLPRTSGWLSHYGDSFVRFCTVPILFVPETNQGASS
jgi:hypothetical protein